VCVEVPWRSHNSEPLTFYNEMLKEDVQVLSFFNDALSIMSVIKR
jgi:hypothetical protein